MKDLIIIGSGVAGLSAGLYAGRYELETEIYGDFFGGATATAWTVENYPGFLEIDGFDLVMKMKEQVEKIGVQVKNDKIIQVNKKNDFFECLTEGDNTTTAKTILFANGAMRRKLAIKNEDEFSKGKGVHYCATCDGPLYRGKTVIVIGTGDSAVKGMNLISGYATKIYNLTLDSRYTAEPINYERLKPHLASKKIETFFQVEIEELIGESRFEGVKLKDGRVFQAQGLFIEIGSIPDTNLASSLGVKLDDKGYIEVNNSMETNVKGIYAAGDTTNFFGGFKQIVTAAAMGSVAATSAFKHCR